MDATVGDKMQILDRDNDGLISADELLMASDLLKDRLTKVAIDAVLNKVKDKDGKVSVEDIAKIAAAMAHAEGTGIVPPIPRDAH